jgi:hypothetical protein
LSHSAWLIAVTSTCSIWHSGTVRASQNRSVFSKRLTHRQRKHASDLLLYKAAKAAFDELGLKKLLTVKALQVEYSELLAPKNKAYTKYHSAKKQMQEIVTAKANVDRFLGDNLESDRKEKSQEQ